MSPSHSFLTFCSQFWLGFCLPWGLSKLDPGELPKYIRLWKRGVAIISAPEPSTRLLVFLIKILSLSLSNLTHSLSLCWWPLECLHTSPPRRHAVSVRATMVTWTRSKPCFPIFHVPHCPHTPCRVEQAYHKLLRIWGAKWSNIAALKTTRKRMVDIPSLKKPSMMCSN